MKPVKTKIFLEDDFIENLKGQVLCLDYMVFYNHRKSAMYYDSENNIDYYDENNKCSLSVHVIKNHDFLPHEIMQLSPSVQLIKVKAGDHLPWHKDKTRHACLYYALKPIENYSPFIYRDGKIGHDVSFWLVDLNDWHMVDNTNGEDRYNLQIVFNETFEEVKVKLENLGFL